jgi:hypothetical protein
MFGSGLRLNAVADLLRVGHLGGMGRSGNKNPMLNQNLAILQSSTLAFDVLPMPQGKSYKVNLLSLVK